MLFLIYALLHIFLQASSPLGRLSQTNFLAFNLTPSTNLNELRTLNLGQTGNITAIQIRSYANFSSVLSPLHSALFIINDYGYTGLFTLTALESLSVPIPSEAILPAAGALVKSGYFNFGIVFLLIIVGNLIGLIVDYYLAYFLGRQFLYNHIKSKKTKKFFDNFQKWFERHSQFSVFVTRLLPVVRTLSSYSAGFTEMPIAEYIYFSMSGIVIWSFVLLMVGYYLTDVQSATVLISIVGTFALILYIAHRIVHRTFYKE